MSKTDKTAPAAVKQARGEGRREWGYVAACNAVYGRPKAWAAAANHRERRARQDAREALRRARQDPDTDVTPVKPRGADWDAY